ncbi:MAG: tetraacyldisaccharide 4'-kinase, partial [Pirellulales bacterium]
PTTVAKHSRILMFRPSDFRALVSGRRRGIGASFARGALGMLEIPYTAAMRWRNRRYDRGAGVHHVDVPVVSVGNLTLGGVGKTPFVCFLSQWLLARGVRPAIISRGYGATGGSNDEALELAERLPEVTQMQHADRVAAAWRAIDQGNCDALVLDDGFQHRRLARDLDIVLLDATEPFGFDHVFPRGALREPVSGLARADVVVLTRADMVSQAARAEICQRAARLGPQAMWAEARHAPSEILTADSERKPVTTLAGMSVAAFCGIGNPEGFRHTLTSCGARVVALREYPDHFDYGATKGNGKKTDEAAPIEGLRRWAEAQPVDAIVTTHKDLVKVRGTPLAERPLWALCIGIELLDGQPELESRLTPIVESALDLKGGI